MAGSWASSEGGKVSEEHWTKPAGGLMLGVHRDTGGAKTAFEFLRIEESSGKITYLASPQGQPPTPFALVESAAQRAVFANPEHDFPQRILYWREGASLCAAVEGPIDGETVSERWCWQAGRAEVAAAACSGRGERGLEPRDVLVHHGQVVAARRRLGQRIEHHARDAATLELGGGLGHRRGLPHQQLGRVALELLVELRQREVTRDLGRLPVERSRVEAVAADQVGVDGVREQQRRGADAARQRREPGVERVEIGRAARRDPDRTTPRSSGRAAASAAAIAVACAAASVGSSQRRVAKPECECSPMPPWLWVTAPSSGSSRSAIAAEVSTTREPGSVAVSTQAANPAPLIRIRSAC